MLQFSANLSLLFTELPLLERFQAAKQAGFNAVEIQFPYELSAEQILRELQDNELKLVMFNVAADTLLQGGEGLAAVPGKQREFKAAVAQALAYAEVLKPSLINVLPGRCLDKWRFTDYWLTLIENLRFAANSFADVGLITVFEAINTHDMPGFIVNSHAKMLALLREVGHPALRLQYDIYHMSRMQENCAEFLQKYAEKIGHIQFADCPGRGQPGTGTVDFSGLFDLISASPYQGWVGAEYKPVNSTVDSLDWLKIAAV